MIIRRIPKPSLPVLLALVIAVCFTVSAEAQTVYITKTGEKYHRESCQHLRRSKIATSLADAKARGYTACSVCRPASGPNAKQNPPPGSSPGKTAPTGGKAAPSTQSRPGYAVQCSGITKAGARCKRTTTNANGRCYQHQ